MGLYLVVFDEDEELEGVEIGTYGDFGVFRDTITERLEAGEAGKRFPILMLHSDCDGSWSPEEAALLQKELDQIAKEFRKLPPLDLKAESWQGEVVKSFGIKPKNLFESFFDVDGEPLIDRLFDLIRVSRKHNKEILFQ